MPMELVANVWPVVHSDTGLVLRYLMRAYAMQASDEVIAATLRALAPTDFRLARTFGIPQAVILDSEHGQLRGCVSIGDFHRHQGAILAPAFAELEKGFARLQGIGQPLEGGEFVAVGVIPRFPEEPYLMVTSLLEMPDGQLVPHVRS